MNRKWRRRRFKSQISLKSSPTSQTPKSSLTFKKHTNSRHMSASMAPDFISLSIYMFKNTKISYKTFGIHNHSKPWQEATKETFYPEREGCVGNVTWGCFNILRFYFYEILSVLLLAGKSIYLIPQ